MPTYSQVIEQLKKQAQDLFSQAKVNYQQTGGLEWTGRTIQGSTGQVISEGVKNPWVEQANKLAQITGTTYDKAMRAIHEGNINLLTGKGTSLGTYEQQISQSLDRLGQARGALGYDPTKGGDPYYQGEYQKLQESFKLLGNIAKQAGITEEITNPYIQTEGGKAPIIDNRGTTTPTAQPVSMATAQPTSTPQYTPEQIDFVRKAYGMSEADAIAAMSSKAVPTPASQVGMASAPQTGQTPQGGATGPGQLLKPSDIAFGTTLKESDIARTTGANIYRRDLAKEQSGLGNFIKLYGKEPKTDTDWRIFHEYVYEGKAPPSSIVGALPKEETNIDIGFLQGEEKPSFNEFIMAGAGGEENTTNALNTIISSVSGQLGVTINNLIEQQKKAADEAARAPYEAEKKGYIQSLKDLVFGTGGQQTAEAKARALLEEYKVQEKQEKLSVVLQEIAKEKESLQLGLTMEANRVAPMSIIGRRQNVLQEQGAARIGALAAIGQVYEGDMERAQALASFVMNAVNSDRTNQINTYEKLIDLAEKNIVNLKKDEKDAINTQINFLSGLIEQTNKNKDDVLKLIMDNPDAALKGKVNLTDTPTQAVAKILPYLAPGVDPKSINIVENEDAAGNVVVTGIDKLTGKILYQTSLGKVGKGFKATGTGGAAGVPVDVANILEAIKGNLEANYMGSDGYINTTQYGNAYKSFAAKYPKYAKYFYDYLPPAAYLNPKDATALPFFNVKPSSDIYYYGSW